MDIEPIPYYYDSIDRNAIIIKPKKPFFNWINSVFEDDEPITELDENKIYLIQAMDDNDQILKWIKQNFDKIFVDELNDWYTGEEKWPKNRTFKMFSDWFEVEICSMILDIENFDIIKE